MTFLWVTFCWIMWRSSLQINFEWNEIPGISIFKQGDSTLKIQVFEWSLPIFLKQKHGLLKGCSFRSSCWFFINIYLNKNKVPLSQFLELHGNFPPTYIIKKYLMKYIGWTSRQNTYKIWRTSRVQNPLWASKHLTIILPLLRKYGNSDCKGSNYHYFTQIRSEYLPTLSVALFFGFILKVGLMWLSAKLWSLTLVWEYSFTFS